MRYRKVNRAFLSLASLCLIQIGCATSPGQKTDAAAEARSKQFLVGYTPALSSDASAGSTCASSKGRMEWRQLVARANACVGKKDWATLEGLANDLAQGASDSPWGPYFLSVSAEGQGDFPRAMWMIDLAMKKSGGRHGLFAYQRARVWSALGETAKAMSEMTNAIALEPRLIEGHIFLAEIHARDLETAKAVEHYRAALALEPTNPRAIAGLVACGESPAPRATASVGSEAPKAGQKPDQKPDQKHEKENKGSAK